MATAKNLIARNTSFFTLALIIQKIIAFVYFTYLARELGAVSLGQYTFALSYITIFAVVIDLGTNHFITREVAKDESQTQKILSHILGFKMVTSVVAVLLAVMFTYILGYDSFMQQLLLIAAVVMVFESVTLSLFSIIRGFRNLTYESYVTIVVQVLIAVAGVAVLQRTQDVRLLLTVLVGAHVVSLLYGLFVLKNRFGLKLRISFEYGYWKASFAALAPFAVAAAFAKLFGAFDQVVLSKLAAPEQLGFYAVAYKLTFALQFLPMAFMAAVYPVLSASYKKDEAKYTGIFFKSVKYLVLVGLPLCVGVTLYASPLIMTLYTSSYVAAIVPLQILFIGLPFIFLNFPIGSLLNASDRQGTQTRNMTIALVLNIILNLVLIPEWQALGAAIASTVSTVVYFVVGIVSVSRFMPRTFVTIGKDVGRIALAVIGMSLAIWLLSVYVVWWVGAVAATLVYAVLLFVLGSVTTKDIRQLRSSLSK